MKALLVLIIAHCMAHLAVTSNITVAIIGTNDIHGTALPTLM